MTQFRRTADLVDKVLRGTKPGDIPDGYLPSQDHRPALRYKLPAVYNGAQFVADGGLVSYGPNLVEQTGQAALYVDRIFKGEKPANLPVQAPTKYELVINLKTAKTLGLTVPSSLLARADQMID